MDWSGNPQEEEVTTADIMAVALKKTDELKLNITYVRYDEQHDLNLDLILDGVLICAKKFRLPCIHQDPRRETMPVHVDALPC